VESRFFRRPKTNDLCPCGERDREIVRDHPAGHPYEEQTFDSVIGHNIGMIRDYRAGPSPQDRRISPGREATEGREP
jgi:hypothetical protein